jgi:serine/threonine-protein kinase
MGAVLYELLTGRWPFEDALLHTPDHRTLAERYPQIRGRRPPRPRTFNAHIPASLETVVLRCLAPHSTHRFPSARALAQALVHCLTGQEQLWPESLNVTHHMV